MKNIAEKQEALFKHLKYIQEKSVVIALSKYKENDNLENLLYEVSFDALCGFLELIDGYVTDEIKLDLIDKETSISMRTNIKLHDKCVDYLRV